MAHGDGENCVAGALLDWSNDAKLWKLEQTLWSVRRLRRTRGGGHSAGFRGDEEVGARG